MIFFIRVAIALKNIGKGEIKAGQEGENLIYLGGKSFWGHFSGEKKPKALGDWLAQVKSWNDSAKIQDYRRRPKIGLDN